MAESNVPEDIVIAPEAGYKSEVLEEVPNDVVTVEADQVEAAVKEVEKAGNNEVAVTEKRLVDEVFLQKLTTYTKLLTRTELTRTEVETSTRDILRDTDSINTDFSIEHPTSDKDRILTQILSELKQITTQITKITDRQQKMDEEINYIKDVISKKKQEAIITKQQDMTRTNNNDAMTNYNDDHQLQ